MKVTSYSVGTHSNFALLLLGFATSINSQAWGQGNDLHARPEPISIDVAVDSNDVENDSTFEGFTEPIRRIDLASDEVGAIFELVVEEGQAVAKDQVIANLDARIQKVQLDIATQLAANRSQLTASAEEFKKRSEIREKLFTLRAQGHASQSEVVRAEMELSIAKAKLETTRAEIGVRELERQRAEVQLQRRTIVAPFAGIVTKILTREGEFLSPMNPDVITLAEMDQLLVRFNIPTSKVSSFVVGQVYNIELANGKTVMATVHQIGVEINAESETVEIKFVIDNPKREFLSGEKVTLST